MRRLPNGLSKNAIRAAWRNSRDANSAKPGAPGVDHVSASKFASSLDANIHKIRTDIASYQYRHSLLRPAPVKKDSGGYRIICIPTVRDQLVQRAIIRHLSDDKRFPKSRRISYGFEKGKSLGSAQKLATKLRNELEFVLKVDIVKFFDNIQRDRIEKILDRYISSKYIRSIIRDAVSCEIDESYSDAASIAAENGIERGRGLRQGLPISPLLTNLLLRDFDKKLDNSKFQAIRYADDIIVFCESKSECKVAFDFIRAELEMLKLEIPDLGTSRKSLIVDHKQTVEFLGIEIRWKSSKYVTSPPYSKLPEIEKTMMETATIKSCKERGRNFWQTMQSLESIVIGHLSSLESVTDLTEFEKRLRSYQKKSQQQLLVELIGQSAAKNLSEDARKIFGIQDL